MQLSRYLTVYPCPLEPDYLLLYSTKKASIIRVHRDTYEELKGGAISSSDESLLSELCIITEDKETEQQDMLRFLDDITVKDDFIDILVVLNLDCNFACAYCFEEAVKSHLNMSPDTAELLVDFIDHKLMDHRKNLKITFYGGEPLLSKTLIQNISQSIEELIKGKNGTYTFSLVTNGSLFTRKTAETLVPLGLKNVQITLDGPPDIHNRYRPFKSGKDSFDVLINNIKETWDLVKISIGGNFDQSNFREFPKLLDILEKDNLTPEKISSVKFNPIIYQPGAVLQGRRYEMGCKTSDEPWALEVEAPLREEILKRGYHTPKPGLLCCMVENPGAFVVNYDGKIYKCPGFIGIDGFSVGDIESGINEQGDPYKSDIWKNPTCLSCKYLPQCFGGCRYMTWLRSGSIDEVDCNKAALDTNLEKLIKQDMKYRPQNEQVNRDS